MQLKLSGAAAGLLLSTKDKTGITVNALVLEAMELLAKKYNVINTGANKGVNNDISTKQQR